METRMPSLKTCGSIIGATTLIVLLILVACTSDAQRVRETNEAARVSQTLAPFDTPSTSLPGPTLISAEIEAVDVQEGDCIDSSIPSGIDIENVVIVLCSGEWQYRVLGAFDVTGANFGADSLPGDDLFLQLAQEKCDRRFTNILIPTQQGWQEDDKKVTCLQSSFGLSATEPEKLDRLVGTDRVHIGECLNDAPETNFLSVEVVSCGGEWEFRVLNIFVLEGFSSFPGDAEVTRKSQAACDRRHSYTFAPSGESWLFGDRSVFCLQQSYGLDTTNMELIERMVNQNSLTEGECFNEVPEANFEMVELVGCLGEWEFRVFSSFQVATDGPFPGEIYFEQQADANCDPLAEFNFTPTAESWLLGDRIVICLSTR